MQVDFRRRYEVAAAAARDGCTPEEIAEEADIALDDARIFYEAALKARRRKETAK